MRRTDAGSASVLAIGAVVVATVLMALVVDVAIVVSHRLRVAAAADAAALAAAPVTFRSFGSRGGPETEAARFAEANGSRLVECRCPVDRSLRTRTVRVVVATEVDTAFFGPQRITAGSAATYSPGR